MNVEYVVSFGDKSSAFVGLAMAEAKSHGAKMCEPIVRCRDCKHGLLHGTECRHFAAYEPIAGGDEYEEMTYSVRPDGFCAWGKRRDA